MDFFASGLPIVSDEQISQKSHTGTLTVINLHVCTVRVQ